MRVFCDNPSCTTVTHLEGVANEANVHAQLRRDGWTVTSGCDPVDPGYAGVLCPRCTKEAS